MVGERDMPGEPPLLLAPRFAVDSREAHGMGWTMERDLGGLLYEQPRLRVVHRAIACQLPSRCDQDVAVEESKTHHMDR